MKVCLAARWLKDSWLAVACRAADVPRASCAAEPAGFSSAVGKGPFLGVVVSRISPACFPE